MEKQLGIASILENNLTVIQSNFKKKRVEETLASLTELRSVLQNDKKELKQMLAKDIRYLEYYKDEQEAVSSCENGGYNNEKNTLQGSRFRE